MNTSFLNSIYLLFFILLCINSFPSFAQKHSFNKVDEQRIRQLFPDEDVVFLKNDEHIFIDYQKGEWTISRKPAEQIYYLENVGNIYSTKSIFYSSFDTILDIDAHTFVPDEKKKKYKVHAVKDIETKDVMNGNIFYSGYQEKEFIFPATQKGAVTSVSYTEQTNEPYLLGAFYFSSYAPVLSANFSITFPKNISLTYKLLGHNTNSIVFKEKKKNGKITYSWTATNLPKIEREENAPSSSFHVPHIAIYINKVKDEKGKEIAIIEDVADLYGWYYNLVKNINKKSNKELQTIVNELIKDAKTDKEKARRIYQWVQGNITYVAFEDGLGGFVPREAADVCTKKYGDCKDMSNIMVEMLKMADVPAYLTWIGTRDRPYSYHDVPTPIVDNHMITTVKLENDYLFLDGTGEYLPFGLPTSMIQGKEALIGLGKNKFDIVSVPIIKKERNVNNEQMVLNIEERDLTGNARASWSGYKKIFAEYSRLKADTEQNKEKFFRSFLRKGNNKFELIEFEDKGFFTRADTMFVDYEFVIPSYVKKVGSKLYVNLNLNKKYTNSKIELDKRKLDKKVEYQYIESFDIRLNLPKGYQVDYLPENADYQDDLFGFSVKYTNKGDHISIQQSIYLNHLLLKKDQFPTWNEMIDALNDVYQEVVVLKKLS